MHFDNEYGHMVLTSCEECKQGKNGSLDWLYFGSKNFNWHKNERDF